MAQVTVNRRETKRGDERLARLVIRAALGAQVTQHDDGSRPRMHDLDILYPDGRRAAGEVVSTRDPVAMSLEAAASKVGYVVRPELTRVWGIVAEADAHLRDLERGAPALLARLEQAGVGELSSFRDPWPPELRALGAARCWSFSPTEQRPPGFFLNAPPSGAIGGDGNDAVQACNEFLARTPDVPAKLLASGITEGHVVVVVTVDWLRPFSSIAAGALPTMAPTLPEGVDCLWMVTLKSPPIRAVFWLGDGVWRDLLLADKELDALDKSEGP
jgi:hypothetical protein